jgi:hypothetical protein
LARATDYSGISVIFSVPGIFVVLLLYATLAWRPPANRYVYATFKWLAVPLAYVAGVFAVDAASNIGERLALLSFLYWALLALVVACYAAMIVRRRKQQGANNSFKPKPLRGSA